MRLKLLAPMLVVLPLLLPGCGVLNALDNCRDSFIRPNIAALTGDLTAARLRWKAANIQDYSYEYFETGFMPFPYPKKVTVSGGQVTATEWVSPKPEYPVLSLSQTVDQRFGAIAAEIGTTSTGQCYELAVQYDATDGHPLKVYGGTSEIADSMGGLTFSNFTRL
jgi:Family of unknown function (DUF6174)